MKKKLLVILIAILSTHCYSQISFEKGYYIDNSNQKIDCLIKNLDWGSNPTKFEFKLTDKGQSKIETIESIKEFGIYNISKYIKKQVSIDRSSENINKLSENKDPYLKKEQLFLKVLIEGKANLYEYKDKNLRRYFYNKESSNIEQLIFKSYKTFENEIRENNKFRQQLWNNLRCSNHNMTRVISLNYNKNDLANFFIEYNQCNNQEVINYTKKQKRDLFNLNLRPRFNNSTLAVKSPSSILSSIESEVKLGFGFGLEAEFILPFYKNKWAIVVEPTYQSYKYKKITNSINFEGGVLITDVNYNSIEIPFGLRHYFFLNEKSKIFINASYVIDLPSKSSIDYKRSDNVTVNSLKITSNSNLAFGIGYKIYDKYSLEMRYQNTRNILTREPAWYSEYNTLSLIIGYSFY